MSMLRFERGAYCRRLSSVVYLGRLAEIQGKRNTHLSQLLRKGSFATAARGPVVTAANTKRRLFPEIRWGEWRLPFSVLKYKVKIEKSVGSEPVHSKDLPPRTEKVMVSLGSAPSVHVAREGGHLADSFLVHTDLWAGNTSK